MKILSILTQSKEVVELNKANRKAKSLKRKQESLIDSLEDKRDDLLSSKEGLLSVTMKSVDEKSWNTEYQRIQVELKMVEAEISIAKETLNELFTDAKGKAKA